MDDLKGLPFNVNKMSISQIIKTLFLYQNVIISGSLMVVFLFSSLMVFKNYYRKEVALHAKMAQVQEKLNVLNRQQQTIKDLNNFKISFSKVINEDTIVTQITSYASQRKISITSLSPAQAQDMGLYDVLKFSLSAVATNYQSMVLFLRDMESSEELFMVNSWKGQGQGEINFDMDISVLRIHL